MSCSGSPTASRTSARVSEVCHQTAFPLRDRETVHILLRDRLLLKAEVGQGVGSVVVHPHPHDLAVAEGKDLKNLLLDLDAAVLPAPVMARGSQDMLSQIGQVLHLHPVVGPRGGPFR